MTRKKVVRPTRLLTDVELELMNILWRLKEGTVTEVQAQLSGGRKLAYTSVSTMLRILEQKNIISSRKEGRGHVYVPLLEKEKYEKTSLDHLVNRVFDGTPVSLVRCLLDESGLTEDDLKAIRQLLNERQS